MARKATRSWHASRRMLARAKDATRSLITRRNDVARLDDVRVRLQHYLRAMYGRPIIIESLAPPKKVGLTTRALRTLAASKEHAESESTAECIRLPATLSMRGANVSPLEQYRVLAVQHAERIRRASARHAREATTDLERDLFQLAEAAAIDAQIIASQPGLRATIATARADALAQRATPRGRTDIERRVEEMVLRAWSTQQNAATETDLPTVPLENDAESNAAWARRTAATLEVQYGQKAASTYRRAPEMTLWQTTITTQIPADEEATAETKRPEIKRERFASMDAMTLRTRFALAAPTQSTGSDDKREKSSAKSASDNSTSGAGPDGDSDAPGKEGEQRREDAKPDAGDESAGASPHAGAEGHGDAPLAGAKGGKLDGATPSQEITFQYPEWDYYARGFSAAGTIVRIVPPSLGSSEWATHALHEHVREVHQAKRQFERLRSHRVRSRRQVQGDELDLEACVDAMVDRRMQLAPTDRLYSLVRPGRRELAITLLLDVSGSTRAVVAGEQRVIDIERVAALVATSAFDALGDDYAIIAFSSEGAANVRVHTLKSFGENNSSLVRQRISALAPGGTTRLGAAVRHATAMLTNHAAPHRLLLILSDGKPHDHDLYSVDYAIQDSRHAVMSARRQGIHPFCITVDASDGETYLAEIFGSAGYRVVSRPSQLSQALLRAVQRLIAGSG